MQVIEEKKYSIEETFSLLGKENLVLDEVPKWPNKRTSIEVDGFNVYQQSLRYMTFYQKGVACCACGKAGTHFRLCGEEKTNRRHFNLYSDDETLITKDHIFPRSKGGKNNVMNMQTMCITCNNKKADTVE